MQTYNNIHRPREAHKQLRCEHNIAKRILIDWASSWAPRPLRVVDLACGKGGDVSKWDRHDICTYIGFDQSRAAIEEARRRARHTSFVFEVNDCIACNIPSNTSVVSMQLAIHYFCDKEERVRALLRNISAALVKGGLFILSTMDWPQCQEFGQQHMFQLQHVIDRTQEYKMPFERVRNMAQQYHMDLCFVRTFHNWLLGCGQSSTHDANNQYIVAGFMKQ